jgi:hypothetical protein
MGDTACLSLLGSNMAKRPFLGLCLGFAPILGACATSTDGPGPREHAAEEAPSPSADVEVPQACLDVITAAEGLNDIATEYVEISIRYQDLIVPAYEAGFRDGADAVMSGSDATHVDQIVERKDKLEEEIGSLRPNLSRTVQDFKAARMECQEAAEN